MELTGPDGIHIVLSGESITKLKLLADGTNMLEPVDGKSDMTITLKHSRCQRVLPGQSLAVFDPHFYQYWQNQWEQSFTCQTGDTAIWTRSDRNIYGEWSYRSGTYDSSTFF